MRWAEVTLVTSPEAAEAVADILISEGSGGVATLDSNHSTLNYQHSTQTAYFPVDDRLEAKLDRIKQRLNDLKLVGLDPGPAEITIKFVEDDDWATAWKSFFKPLVIGKIVVKPTWEQFDAQPGQIILEIDPGMAFGTGNHPTTRMCLLALQRLIRPGGVMLDMGCGSGILAIAGALLGASKVLGVEIDSVAVKAARENVAVNGVESTIEIIEADSPSSAGIKADFIVANIVADAIIGMVDNLVAALKPGGTLITSGIVDEREAGVASHLKSVGLELSDTIRDGEWITLITTIKPSNDRTIKP